MIYISKSATMVSMSIISIIALFSLKCSTPGSLIYKAGKTGDYVTLEKYINKGSTDIRLYAIRSLPDIKSEKAQAILLKALVNSDPRIRREALLLVSFNSIEEQKHICLKYLKDEYYVTNAALERLRNVQLNSYELEKIAYLLNTNYWNNKLIAAEILAKNGNYSGEKIVTEALYNDFYSTKREAARIISLFPAFSDTSLLYSLFINETDPETKKNLWMSIRTIKERNESKGQ